MYLNLFLMDHIQQVLVAKQTHKYGPLNTKDSFELFDGGDGYLFSHYWRIKNAAKILYGGGGVFLICCDFKYVIAT